jgi:hypothetical protein
MKMAYDRQKQQQQQQFKIDVDANEIVHVKDDEFEGTITVTLTRGNRAASGQQVQVFLAGHLLGEPQQTDGNGKVVKDFSIKTAAKTISIEAQNVGFATRGKKFIDLPRPQKESKAPAKIIPNESGSAGNYSISFQVLAQDDSPVPKAKIRICDTTGHCDLKPTDKNGVAVYKTVFTEKEKIVRVIVLGSQAETWVNLFNEKEATK